MKVIIVGAGVHAKVVAETLSFDKHITILGFTDHDKSLHGKKILGFPVLGDDEILATVSDKKNVGAIIGIGNSNMTLRHKLFTRAVALGFRMVNAIHPEAIVSPSATLGTGLAVFAGAIINPEAQLKDNVVINTGAIVEHDNVIGNNVYVSPGVTLSGNVTLRNHVFIGSGAVILPGISIGERSVIGAGAVVTKNIPPGVVSYGVPAKISKTNPR